MVDEPQTTKKRMPLMMEQDGHIVGVVDAPPVENWPLIAELLRSLASKIEECYAE